MELPRFESIHLYAFSSWIGTWNSLVKLSIDDREVMEGGGEGTSDKKANEGREWFSAADMPVYGEYTVVLQFFM